MNAQVNFLARRIGGVNRDCASSPKGDLYDHESLVKAIKQVDLVISSVGHMLLPYQDRIIAAIKEAGNVKKRVAKGDCSFVCGLGAEVVDAYAIPPLNVVLVDGSSTMTSSGEERALVVVGEASLKERDNSMGWLKCGAESAEEWKSCCLAQFSDFLGMSTIGFEEEILVLLKNWKLRKE
ncbi:Isoflavone reductase-like [Vitis vinifera]|uniref:Isoflavone reductase-like n=1 Tax=Vitis vinifera TaxID=29760 RepID=A0A438EKI2_VITVI|nr:Isoflavone reductase-like [Vitis vinifera]